MRADRPTYNGTEDRRADLFLKVLWTTPPCRAWHWPPIPGSLALAHLIGLSLTSAFKPSSRLPLGHRVWLSLSIPGPDPPLRSPSASGSRLRESFLTISSSGTCGDLATRARPLMGAPSLVGTCGLRSHFLLSLDELLIEGRVPEAQGRQSFTPFTPSLPRSIGT